MADDIELTDSRMIADQLARVTVNMLHSLYGNDDEQMKRMGHLLIGAIPSALSAEISKDATTTRNSPWRTHRKSRTRAG